MPELVFKGKEYVYNHHLTVPYRPLLADASKSIGAPDLGGNLIIHGDNLHALKALLPRYAGKVDLIFIDPPYNTGNEGWCYNDNVNSPMMKEWLSNNPVGIEDMLRHDKWLAMMWPRLTLLRELLSETGSLWMTLDDNEVHRARSMLDEIFGEQQVVATCIWHKMDSPKNTAEFFSEDHDYILVYAKDKSNFELKLLPRTEDMLARYKNPDNDPRGLWLLSDLAARNHYAQGLYPITTKSGRVIDGPPSGSYWRVNRERFDQLDKDGRIWWGESGDNRPGIKRFLSDVKDGVVAQTLWSWKDVGSTRNSKQALSQMMSSSNDDELFITPKPVQLIERVLDIGANKDALILDSFAGSGTTAHAVLRANTKDNGTRRFILVEGEDYADRLTAERVRRAINGYAWVGNQRETLLEEKLTWTQLKKANALIEKVDAVQKREGFADNDGQMALGDSAKKKTVKRRFDKLNVKVDDGVLRVEGEKRISERVDGLGGSFTYCTLGEPLEVQKLLSGEHLPDFDALGAWLFHTATGGALPQRPKSAPAFYLGEALDKHVWLQYQPDLAFLKSPDSALTLTRAKEIAAWGRSHPNGRKESKGHLVFAPAKYMSHKQLLEHGIEFAQLPFALYREA